MPRCTSHLHRNNDEIRQMNATRERQRRQSMTEEQRHAYLNRRRSNYQRIRSELLSETNKDSNADQRVQRRLSYHSRQRSMNEEQRSNYLTRRRQAYQRRCCRHPTSSNQDAMEESRTNNLVAPPSANVDPIPNPIESCDNAITVRQTCRIEQIPYHNLTSTFERGNTSSCQQHDHQGDDAITVQQISRTEQIPYHNLTSTFERGNTSSCQQHDHQDIQLNIFNEMVHESTNDNEDVRRYQQHPNPKLKRPTRFQIISPGWKITIGINVHDFGRWILRVFRKLKRHVEKRTGWIEGWDLTERGILARRNMEENTLFRKKIRCANDDDIAVFYNHHKSEYDDLNVTSAMKDRAEIPGHENFDVTSDMQGATGSPS